LIFSYIFSAFYKDTLPSNIPENIEKINIVIDNKKESKDNENPAKENLPEKLTIMESIKQLIGISWRICVYTPFGITQIMRVYVIMWALKYNSALSAILLFWLYYSIFYKNEKRFITLTPYLLVLPIGLQIIATKIIEIPWMVTPSFKYYDYLSVFGFFTYKYDERINEVWEYLWIFGGFLLACGVHKFRLFLPKYQRYCSEFDHKNSNLKKQNNLEIVVNFILFHTEKLYIVLLYIMSLNKLNIARTLILIFLFLFILVNNFARKYFKTIIFILMYRALFRYFILIGYLLKFEYSQTALKVFAILGIESSYDNTVMIWKLAVDPELILMFFCTYLELRIIQYLNNAQKSSENNENEDNGFLKVCKFINSVYQTYLLWIIYFVILVLLAYQEPTIFDQGYSIFAVILIFIHALGDHLNNMHGFLSTKPVWLLMSVYNVIILLISYMFCFLVYTCELSTSIESLEERVQFLKIVGFDFDQPTGWKLQRTFLPQFVVLYLSYIARTNIDSRAPQSNNKQINVKYSMKIISILLDIVDVLSKYSFHVFFFAVIMLGILWSLNFMMLGYLIFFGIHFAFLHYRYINTISMKKSSTTTRLEKAKIIEEESEIQKNCAIYQRRRTLTFIMIFSCIVLLLCQIFRFLHVYKEYFSICYNFGKKICG